MLRKWLWWPTVKSHASAGGLAFIAVTALGIAEIPRFPSFKEFTAVQASPAEFFTLAAVISMANACFLFLHARGDYLTARSGLLPMFVTFLLLSATFPIAWSVFRITFKNAPFPEPAALASGVAALAKGTSLSNSSTHEWTRASRALFVGEAGLTMVLLFSGLWKPPPQNTLYISNAWDRARPLVRRVFRPGGALLTEPEHTRLKAHLAGLVEGAEALDTTLVLQADLEVAASLATHAQTVLELIDEPFGALENLRTINDQGHLAAVRFLLGEANP